MKNENFLIGGLLSLITLIFLFGFSAFQSSIIGSWVSETDPKSKLVFASDRKCKEYYNNELQDKYAFVTSNTSP